MNTRLWILGFVLIAGFGIAIPGAALAQAQWDKEKGNCDAVLTASDQAGLADLNTCMRLWEAYRDVSRVKDPEKQAAARAFTRVFKESDEQSRHIAEGALQRLGFAPPPQSAAGKAGDAAGRKKYRPHAGSPADQKAAQKLRSQAMKAYKKKDWSGALGLLDQALKLDPAYVQALYDAACCFALDGDKDNAIEYLRRLADIGSKESLEKVRKSRTDSDFAAYHDDPAMKAANGYATIKVLNGMDKESFEMGEENVFKLVEVLKDPKMGYKAAEGGEDKHPRDRPHIWYKEHAKNQALVVMKIINHPKTRLVPMDWDGSEDLIVSWADKVEVGRDGEKVAKYSMTKKGGPSADPEKRMDQALAEQDNALREPEEYARKVEHVASTPDRIEGKVDSATNRVDRAVDTIDKAADKAGSLFK